jgi:hypothetical protein
MLFIIIVCLTVGLARKEVTTSMATDVQTFKSLLEEKLSVEESSDVKTEIKIKIICPFCRKELRHPSEKTSTVFCNCKLLYT